MGAGGERCVFSASHRADLPLLRARPVLALLGENLRAVLVARRSHAEPLAVLDLDLLPTEFARPGAVAEFRRHSASALTGAPASTVRLQASSRASFAAGEVRTAVAASTPMTNDAKAAAATTRLMPVDLGFGSSVAPSSAGMVSSLVMASA